MSDDMIDDTLKATARRRLVRGVFSVPAVLTLYSGGAVAAASSRCDTNTAQTGVTLVMDNPDDAYLRYQLWARVKLANSNVDSYYVKGAELATMVGVNFNPSDAKPADGTWQKLDVGTGMLSSVRNTEAELLDNGGGNAKYSLVQNLEPKWVVLRVDSNGAVVGVGNGTSGLLVTESCASSLVGAAVLA